MPRARKPLICYVTDRRGLQSSHLPGAESTKISFQALETLREAVRIAAAAGATWIQIREKDIEGGALARLLRLAVEDTRATGARILVNDRLDIAVAASAAGIHLGEKSLPVEAVAQWRRSSGRPDFQIGVSCHSLDSARAAQRGGADYIFFGPVFATPSKAAFGAPQGIERLRELCAAVTIPVLAIGGIDFENARACLDAGAAGIAAIRLFQNAANVNELTARLSAI